MTHNRPCTLAPTTWSSVPRHHSRQPGYAVAMHSPLHQLLPTPNRHKRHQGHKPPQPRIPKFPRNSHRACMRNSYANTIHRQSTATTASSQRRSSSEPTAPSLACGTNITRASITPPRRWERFSPNGPSQPWAQSTIQPRTVRANGPSRSIPTTRWSKPRPETGTHRT